MRLRLFESSDVPSHQTSSIAVDLFDQHVPFHTSILAEYDGAGARTKRYAYLERHTAPVQLQDGNGTYYVHADRLGAPLWVTNSGGVAVWGARYEAYGRATVQSDLDGDGIAVVLNMRLPGQYEDVESGLHYNVMRDYDPATGRYISADPLGLAPGPNPYIYVGGRPTAFVDPLGLYSGSKIPTCAPYGIAEIITQTRNWFKSSEERVYRLKVRSAKPDFNAGWTSSRDPRPTPSWGVEFELWWQERLVVTVWNGHTITTWMEQTYRCEARWTEDCGEERMHESFHTKRELLGVHTYWAVKTRYDYDWQWLAPAGEMDVPGV